jgi:hypothetical protein
VGRAALLWFLAFFSVLVFLLGGCLMVGWLDESHAYRNAKEANKSSSPSVIPLFGLVRAAQSDLEPSYLVTFEDDLVLSCKA